MSPKPRRPRSERDEEIARLEQGAETIDGAARAANTWRAYNASWAIFERWCASLGFEDLPASPETVRLFLVAQRNPAAPGEKPKSYSTLVGRLAAIRQRHLDAELSNPCDAEIVRRQMAGIRRSAAPTQRKRALVEDLLVRLVGDVPPDGASAIRDRAVLLLGFAGAFRRSELVAIDAEHLHIGRDALAVQMLRSKTNQGGRPDARTVLRQRGSPYCPVAALEHWLDTSGVARGPVFVRVRRGETITTDRLAGAAVAAIVKRHARNAGVSVEQVRELSGHSLRRGFATEAHQRDVDLLSISRQLGHRSVGTTAGYVAHLPDTAGHAGRNVLTGDRAADRDGGVEPGTPRKDGTAQQDLDSVRNEPD